MCHQLNAAPLPTKTRVEVLCLTYGEPRENRFRPQYEYSHSILNRLTRRVAPIPEFVTPLLAARRGLERARKFEEIKWNSPLEEYSRQQVEALQIRLGAERPDIEWRVKLVFEFRRPYIWEFLEPMTAYPPDEIIVVPLYVADSDFTSGVSRTDLARFHQRFATRGGENPLPPPRYLEGFGFDPRSGKTLANFIWKQCQEAGWNEEKCRDSVLILGAHGTLIRPPAGINSGAKETRWLFGEIRAHLKPRFRSIRIGWLNHTLGGTWTFPEVAESARESQEHGIRQAVYYPFGFVGDNGESQLEGKMQLANFQWDDMLYLPCPNADDNFIALLTRRVIERLDGPRSDWETIGFGNAELETKERPAVAGSPGNLNFRGPQLAAAAAAFWLALGLFLALRGLRFGAEVETATGKAIVLTLGLVAGYYKGTRMLGPMAKKNLLRLRRIPQPSPLYRMFSKATWIVVLCMSLLGMLIRFAPVASGLRGTILIAVGIAMLIGATAYLKNIRLATPLAQPDSAPPKTLQTKTAS